MIEKIPQTAITQKSETTNPIRDKRIHYNKMQNVQLQIKMQQIKTTPKEKFIQSGDSDINHKNNHNHLNIYQYKTNYLLQHYLCASLISNWALSYQVQLIAPKIKI